MSTPKQTADMIIERVGGRDNITNLWHCVTRLRFQLKDQSLADAEAIKDIPGVHGINPIPGQLQVVVGQNVHEIYELICDAIGLEKEKMLTEADFEKVGEGPRIRRNPVVGFFSGMFDALSNCVAPLTTAFVGSGLIKSILALCTTYQLLSPESGLYKLFSAAGDAAFYFLPFLLAYTAARKFRANTVMSLLLAGIYMSPGIMNNAGTAMNVLGLDVKLLTYSNTVIPIILSVWVLGYVDRWLEKHAPSQFRVILVPLVTLLVMTPLSIILIGPIGYYIGTGMANVFLWLFENAPIVAGLVIGATRPWVIIIGMNIFAPIMINNIATLGYDTMNPVLCVATMAAAGMCFGVFLKVKRASRKTEVFSSFISAMIGITEPALFGVAFRYKRPLWACMLGGGLAGAFVSAFGAKAIAFAMPALMSLPIYAGSIPIMLVGLAISFVVSASCAYIFTDRQQVDGAE